MNMQITPPADNRDVPAHETQPGAHPARRYAIGGIAIILVLGGFYYWTHSGDNAPRRGPVVAPVRVANVVQRDMEVVEHTIGTVVANSTVSVTARVQGQLTKAYFKEGQMVKEGDLLFEIDPRPYQAAYDNAVATLASAKSQRRPLSAPVGAERDFGAAERRCPGRLSAGQGQCGSRAPQSGIHQDPLAGERQDRSHPAAAGQSGVGQRPDSTAGHHYADPADQSVVHPAAIGPAAHPGARPARRADGHGEFA